MINGVINVYKEAGYTSHDVVAKLRGILKQKKIGHTGTLDPDATGVLPVCLGNGTKLCDLLTDKDKTYEAVMLLGTTTDTQDTSGTILTENEVLVSEEEVLEAIKSFIGGYDQVPPMYSALKVNGKKLYELAREGKVVERKSRPIQIYDIIVNEINLKEKQVSITVHCSKGTYIRTLCHDIGAKLGCGGCMSKLKRTMVSSFSLEDSLTLSEIEALAREGSIMNAVISVDALFPHYDAIIIKEDASRLIYNGNSFLKNNILSVKPASLKTQSHHTDSNKVRVYDFSGNFVGIYKEIEQGVYKPEKMFL